MPNGHIHDPGVDAIFHRHTEHGLPRFWTEHWSEGWLVAHLDHHRGYAYEGDWRVMEPHVDRWRGVRAPTLAEVAAVAAELVAALEEVMRSNPRSRVRADRASAFLRLGSFAIQLGGYHLYTHRAGGRFERVPHPLTEDPILLGHLARDPELDASFRHTAVVAGGGLPMHRPEQCVHALGDADAWIATTVPLHEAAGWEALASAEIDSIASDGHLLSAMRAHAVEKGTEHVLVRGRCPPAMRRAATAAQSSPPAPADGAQLEMLRGPDRGRPFSIGAGCLLGRAADCDVPLDTAFASLRHARIEWRGDAYWLVDLGSDNGSLVNGAPVRAQALEDDDVIMLGDILFRFHLGQTILWDGHLAVPRERTFFQALDVRRGAGADVGAPAFLLLSIDRIGHLYQALGGEGAERLLGEIEAACRAALPPEDLLVRIGPDRFAMAHLGDPAADPQALCDALEAAVTGAAGAVDGAAAGRPVSLRVSTGWAARAEPSQRTWQQLEAAQRHLEARRASRRPGG